MAEKVEMRKKVKSYKVMITSEHLLNFFCKIRFLQFSCRFLIETIHFPYHLPEFAILAGRGSKNLQSVKQICKANMFTL